MFKCDQCDKSCTESPRPTRVKVGHLQTHHQFPISQTSEFSCQVPNCKYVGSKSKDLQGHVTGMHKTAKSSSPTHPHQVHPSTSGATTADQSNVLSVTWLNLGQRKSSHPRHQLNSQNPIQSAQSEEGTS